MQIYKKKMIISELVLIILTLCTIKVSSLIDESDEHDFKDALKYILYMVDFGINISLTIVYIVHDIVDSCVVTLCHCNLFFLCGKVCEVGRYRDQVNTHDGGSRARRGNKAFLNVVS